MIIFVDHWVCTLNTSSGEDGTELEGVEVVLQELAEGEVPEDAQVITLEGPGPGEGRIVATEEVHHHTRKLSL